jgi:hypothetical protein
MWASEFQFFKSTMGETKHVGLLGTVSAASVAGIPKEKSGYCA